MKKKNEPRPKPVIETNPFERSQAAKGPAEEYTIQMALAEAQEKYRNCIRPIDRWTIARAAQTILREKRAATELPRRFEGRKRIPGLAEISRAS